MNHDRSKRISQPIRIDLAKARLQSRRQELLATTLKQGQELGESSLLEPALTREGDVDDAIYSLDRDTTMAIVEKQYEELAAIEKALSSIEEGTWGSCVQCGGLIEADRLIARPESVWCINCKTVEEKKTAHGDSTPSI